MPSKDVSACPPFMHPFLCGHYEAASGWLRYASAVLSDARGLARLHEEEQEFARQGYETSLRSEADEAGARLVLYWRVVVQAAPLGSVA